jgi:glycosyltransferase involved in cell wall biosynthesis
MALRYRGRLALQQRVLPNYRVPFFDLLASACDDGLSVFAGQARAQEGIVGGRLLVAQHARARNVHILAGPAYACWQPGLRKWLESWNPRALIVEANSRYLSTATAVRWMHERGRKVIGWGLGAPPPRGSLSGLFQSRKRGFLHQFDALIAYSRRGASEYTELGFAPDRIFVATNAVAPRPGPAPRRRRPAAARPAILFVGRLQKRKRVDLLMKACAALPAEKPRLVIVGDGPERAALEALAGRVYPSAEFKGPMHGEELALHFREADLFVLPGTGGLAIQEAMANALPVIVARGDGTQDDLVRRENGWQVSPDDCDELARTLRTALSDPPRLRRMGMESHRIVQEEINLETMVDAFMTALTSLE